MKYKLESICLKITDGSHYSPSNDTKGNIPMLSVKDMEEFDFNYDKCKHISKEEFDKMLKNDCVPKINDVLVAKDGSYLKEIFVNENENQKAILSSIAIFRPDIKIIDPYFLCYLLKTPMISNYIKDNCVSGSALPRIILRAFKRIELEIPVLKTQQRIVRIIKKINDKIKINNKINNNLHDLAEQQFNEIYLKGSPKKLGELLVNISTGSRPKGGAQDCGVPSIGAEKIEKFGVYNYSSEKYISEEYYEKLKNGKLNSGDVLLYKDGAYTGKVSMCLNDFPHKKAAVNEHVFILNTKNNWAQNYLYFTLYNRDNKEMIHRLACSKAAQPGLNQIELKSVEVNICDEKEIINFENSVKPIMEKISSNTLENKKLVELRDTLLPKLMNGEIDLDNIEI